MRSLYRAIICRKPREKRSKWAELCFKLDIDKLANFSGRLHHGVNFFFLFFRTNTKWINRIRSLSLFLILSLSSTSFSLSHLFNGVKNAPNRATTPFRSNVPPRTSTRVQTRFHANDVDLVARSAEREPRYIRPRV